MENSLEGYEVPSCWGYSPGASEETMTVEPPSSVAPVVVHQVKKAPLSAVPLRAMRSSDVEGRSIDELVKLRESFRQKRKSMRKHGEDSSAAHCVWNLVRSVLHSTFTVSEINYAEDRRRRPKLSQSTGSEVLR